ncbi:hypothetical protein KI387_000412 [Taxus chinensis]|uniref:Disease resistance protein n=1 Tax=Taxus chinensis TaxID=29808 RepID=A0AA38GT25_TAXCH|nr:hypothetical protein KI387_000412 [Taxus chinensis]
MDFVGEAVVGKTCEMAIEVAVQQLVKEARLVVSFREDFEWLNVKLTYLRGFLTDAGEQSKQNAAVKKWLQKIQDVSMQAEDIVEECAIESLYSDNTQSCVLSCNQLIFRHRMGQKIKDVKDRISSIIEDADLLRVSHDVLSQDPASSGALRRGADWKRSSLLPIDSHPVGINSKVDYIASLLHKSAHPVITVVGIGGMGKTYLLQHVYNKTNQRFEISIWLSISQSYSIHNLQYDIAKYIGLRKEIVEGKVSEQVAAQSIHAKLEGKKCLIVLDDVWKPMMEENLIERLGFRIGNNCKIVITTRNKDVCRVVDAEIYEMEYLSEEESWELFCVYGFPHCEANRPPQHIEEVAHNIVEECGKLPLAIKMTASSLSHTTLPREWAVKLRQLKEVSDLNDPMKILKLSYDCLPAHLKACFAYFCFFSDDEKMLSIL